MSVVGSPQQRAQVSGEAGNGRKNRSNPPSSESLFSSIPDGEHDAFSLLSVGPSIATTASSTLHTSLIGRSQYSMLKLFTEPTQSEQARQRKAVAFVREDSLPAPLHLTKENLSSHTLASGRFEHTDFYENDFITRLMLRKFYASTAPDAKTCSLTPNGLSSVKSQFAASTCSHSTQISEMSHVPVNYSLEEFSDTVAMGTWADVPITYRASIDLLHVGVEADEQRLHPKSAYDKDGVSFGRRPDTTSAVRFGSKGANASEERCHNLLNTCSTELEQLSLDQQGPPNELEGRNQTSMRLLTSSDSLDFSSDSQDETETSSSDSGDTNVWEKMDRVVKTQRRNKMIFRMITWLTPWLEARLSVLEQEIDNNSSSGDGSKGKMPCQGTSTGQQSTKLKTGQKRLFSARRGQNDDEKGDTDEEPEDQRLARRLRTVPDQKLWLACPFYQRNPDSCRTSRTCFGPGWPTCHRVKEHLYRVHGPPDHQCPRCRKVFKKNEDFEAHARASKTCENAPDDSPPGFNKDQKKRLKSRKKPESVRSEFDNWTYIYGILFPGEDIPSPYYQQGTVNTQNDGVYASAVVTEIRRHVRADFSRLMHERLAPEFDATLEQHFSSQRLVSLAETVLDGILQGFQQSRASAVGDAGEARVPPETLASAALEESLVPSVSGPVIPSDSLDGQMASGMLDSGYWDFSLEQLLHESEIDMSHPAGSGANVLANETGALPMSFSVYPVQIQRIGFKGLESSQSGGVLE